MKASVTRTWLIEIIVLIIIGGLLFFANLVLGEPIWRAMRWFAADGEPVEAKRERR